MVAYQLPLRQLLRRVEEAHHLAYMAEVEGGRMALVDAAISATVGEAEAEGLTRGGSTEVCHQGSGGEGKHHQTESPVLAEGETEVTAVIGVAEGGGGGNWVDRGYDRTSN
jgi:N-acetylmuramic acid 6-phosphate (MurNAc-6-P) etherase